MGVSSRKTLIGCGSPALHPARKKCSIAQSGVLFVIFPPADAPGEDKGLFMSYIGIDIGLF
jgi:hypothetical protein